MATSSTINTSIARFVRNEDLIDRVTNGDSQTDVQTAGGLVPSLAKTMRLLGEQSASVSDEFLEGLQDAVNARADTTLDAMDTRINESADLVLTALDQRVNTDADGILAEALAAKATAESKASEAAASKAGADTAAGLAANSSTSASSSAGDATAAKVAAELAAANAAEDAAVYDEVQEAFVQQATATAGAQAQLLTGLGASAKKAELAAGGGSKLIGSARTAITDLVASTLDSMVNALEFSIFEFMGSVSKPNPADPSTWDWTTAFAVGRAALIVLGGGTLKIPRGKYYVSGNGIESAPSTSGFRMDPAIRYLGEGAGTVISRRETASTDIPDRANPATFHQSAFNLYGSNQTVESLWVRDSKTAFYLGQKTGEVDTCNVSFCRIKDVWITDCGIAFHLRSGAGTYYNSIENVHVFQCQIGEYSDAHPSSLIAAANNNRNHLRMVRHARCHVGTWIVKGDTNQLVSVHNEGNTAAPTGNRYAAPAGLPFGVTAGVGTIFEANATNNALVACMNENNVLDLVNGGARNSFSGLFGDEAGKVRHVVRPYFYSTQTMSVTAGGNAFWFTNTQTDAFAGYSPGVYHYDSAAQFHKPILQVAGNAFKKTSIFDLGAVASAATASLNLWDENDDPFPAVKVAYFDLTVLGNSQADSLVIATTFKIIAFRSVSRTLISYYVYDVVNGRALGVNSGDAANPFVLALSAGGPNSKHLMLAITAPRPFADVSVVAERLIC